MIILKFWYENRAREERRGGACPGGRRRSTHLHHPCGGAGQVQGHPGLPTPTRHAHLLVNAHLLVL